MQIRTTSGMKISKKREDIDERESAALFIVCGCGCFQKFIQCSLMPMTRYDLIV